MPAVRTARECQCDKANVARWGYQLFFWNKMFWMRKGGPKRTVQEALDAAGKSKVILIVCRACGSEPLREYP